jgi:hypothetical protein
MRQQPNPVVAASFGEASKNEIPVLVGTVQPFVSPRAELLTKIARGLDIRHETRTIPPCARLVLMVVRSVS